MLVQIIRDQAVWERETFYVEVPDGLEDEALTDAISEAEENYQGYTSDPGYTKEVLDEAVFSVDIERKAVLPGGDEIEY